MGSVQTCYCGVWQMLDCNLWNIIKLFFHLFLNRFHKGDVLITTATGVMSEEEGEKWGLVPTHAYAVLDIREYKVSNEAGGVFKLLLETYMCF